MESRSDADPRGDGSEKGGPTGSLVDLFVDVVQKGRIEKGQRPAERPVFRKLHGVAFGHLEMSPDRPQDTRTGFLADDRLPAWVRFSSDTSPDSPDLGSTVGVGIKLFGAKGPRAFGGEGETSDLVLQNFPVFFVADARTMCEFTRAGVLRNDYAGYLAEHPATKAILDAMQTRNEGSVLGATYWGILPFQCGDGPIVKYRLDPETPVPPPANPTHDYLAADMASRLRTSEYRYRLMVQRRTNPDAMPLDDATVEWPEVESPFIHVATLVLPRQDVTTPGQAEYGQSLAFNIFRVPPEQAPAAESSIAAARCKVYAASAEVRHHANGQPTQDGPPRVPELAATESKTIVRAVIHPAIGIARVGSSQNGWFIGPEVPEPPPLQPGSYRDASGALKRQAARFRIYGVNAAGNIVAELTGRTDVKVSWTVELANTKSAWYTFQLALDVPEASAAPPTTLRNAAVADRSRLAIRPGRRTLAGPGRGPERFDTGTFMDRKVYLGEAFTDDQSRLVVLGGRGVSWSYDGSRAITFANNEGWHDDLSDGPVTAQVAFDGRVLDVVPAWVVVAPPNYGPQRKSVRTMWDLMRDVAVSNGMLLAPARPSFTLDILPIFQRMAGLQWVNAGFAAGFGWEGEFDLVSAAALSRLSDPGEAHKTLRKTVSNAFRSFEVDSWSPKPWPWLYGDAMNIPPAPTPRQHSSLSGLQLGMLVQWAAGDFEADWGPRHEPPDTIEKLPVSEQGAALTKAALDFCLADAFHPGCEMTWPVRAASIYMMPFRFRHAPDGWVAPGLGEILTSDAVTIPNGPLWGQQAGDVTRWMAVPWQTDTASCQSGYDKTYDPYVPTFWPARVPNQVLSRDQYKIVMDTSRPATDRLSAFAVRQKWLRPLGTVGYTDLINNMIHGFDRLGVVETARGPSDLDSLPSVLEVEDIEIAPTATAQAHTGAQALQATSLGIADPVNNHAVEKVRRFPGGLPVQIK